MFSFSDQPNTAVFVCSHVLKRERPILLASHDEDGYWQFLCGYNHSDGDAKIISLYSAYELDNSIEKLADLDYGHRVEREDISSEWIIS